jgi:hypothetical protein
MSGGYFGYNQFIFNDIAREIERIIENNSLKDDFGYSTEYPAVVLDKLRTAVKVVNQAGAMVHRIDWLVSGDDGEETFLRRWKEDLRAITSPH